MLTQVRRNLRLARQGFVETDNDRVERELTAILEGRTGHLRRDEASSAATESEGDGSHSSEAGSHDADEVERRFLRVSIDRLDALMNFAGELVVSRSRLVTRLEAIRGHQLELGRCRRRLAEAVDRFREQNEFNLGAARLAEARPAAPALALGTADGAGHGSVWDGFSELELDRYDDLNVLARSVAEISNDAEEIDALSAREFGAFADDSDAFSSIVSGIQSEITRSRMVPLETMFTRLHLSASDAAQRSGRRVRVETVGEDVLFDKTMADALFAPMLHLVRNAIGHGIESPEERIARGKPEIGVVTLSASQESGQVVIQVSDDGGGLDLAALHRAGVASGAITEDVELDDPAVQNLVFVRGLSTREHATEVSGRGVGGDIVRRGVERLNGTIRVYSQPGVGTTFTMAMPLTLAITRAILCRASGRTYAVPLYFADRLLLADDVQVVTSAGQRRMKIGKSFQPLRGLNELFGVATDHRERGPILVLRVGSDLLGLQVDEVVGQEEIVVKGLGEVLTGHPLFSGMTIRGSGELALIIDVPALIAEHVGTGRRSGLGGVAPAARVDASDDTSTDGTSEGPPGRRTDPTAPSSTGKAEAAAAPARAKAPAAKAPRSEAEAPPAPGAATKPAKAPPGKQAAEPAKKRPTAVEEPARTVRILFVDDSLSVRKVAERSLQGLGVEVVLAVDGADAMTKLREHDVDMVFTDLEMPRLNGYELIRELRYIPAYKDLPVVVVTSRSGDKHREQAMNLGANDYLTKPFTADTLAEAMTKLCGFKRSAR